MHSDSPATNQHPTDLFPVQCVAVPAKGYQAVSLPPHQHSSAHCINIGRASPHALPHPIGISLLRLLSGTLVVQVVLPKKYLYETLNGYLPIPQRCQQVLLVPQIQGRQHVLDLLIVARKLPQIPKIPNDTPVDVDHLAELSLKELLPKGHALAPLLLLDVRPDPRQGLGGAGDAQPVLVGSLRLRGNDLNCVPVLYLMLQRHKLPIHSCAAAVAAKLRVDSVGEVDDG
mmetsp:Transcript_54434/g.133048  ORF Transcript_54434/g.133048 Transcript_54434/m.133048 type:complete len:229 (+) Transcript_54434:482-1168(+)